MGVVHVDDRDQHEPAPERRVDEEFYRRVNSPGGPPDSYDEIHGNQYRFPEYEEKNHVQRDKGPDKRRFKKKSKTEERSPSASYRVPGTEDRNGKKKGRDKHEQEAKTVDSQMIRYPKFRKPGNLLLELHCGKGAVEAEKKRKRYQEFYQGYYKRNRL